MKNPPKITVLSIDGLSYGLLASLMKKGIMPTLAGFCETYGYPQLMSSEYPPVSNVAWTSYATGKNPGKHGIYGFFELNKETNKLKFPNSRDICGKTLWKIFSEHNKKIFVMNVPCTYPPQEINGIMIGGFLGSSLDGISNSRECDQILKDTGYRIDADISLARNSKKDFIADLKQLLVKRCETMLYFLDKENWDYFHVHIMGTDRINHFVLRHYYEKKSPLHDAFCDYYHAVDSVFAQLLEQIGDDSRLLLLSDHGFCPIKYEVNLGKLLVDNGWTIPVRDLTQTTSLPFDLNSSKAFCLTPGRIYINLEGRYGKGCVSADEYDKTREAIADLLMDFRDDGRNPVIDRVLKCEDIYWPANLPLPENNGRTSNATSTSLPDLIALSKNGYDLKMGVNSSRYFINTEREGMHTYPDAMCITRGIDLPPDNLAIHHLAGILLDFLDIAPDADMDLHANSLASAF